MKALHGKTGIGRARKTTGLKPKDLVGIPWRVAFALQDDGWWLRSDIIWHKTAPMPESVDDRPTRSHEYVFLLSKSARYFYDAAAVRTPAKAVPQQRNVVGPVESAAPRARPHTGLRAHGLEPVEDKQRGHSRRHAGFNDRWDSMSKDEQQSLGANLRDVWTLGPEPFAGAHYAVMPLTLATTCVLAGSRRGGHVLDPFCGAGTTGVAATLHERSFTGLEIHPDNVAMARTRIRNAAPLFNASAERLSG